MRTEPSSIPHGFRFRRNSRSSMGPMDCASKDLDAAVADGSFETRALSSGCLLTFFDDSALVFTSRYPSGALHSYVCPAGGTGTHRGANPEAPSGPSRFNSCAGRRHGLVV